MTSPTYGRWGFFLFTVGSDMSGNIQSYDRATLVAEDKDLKALGIGAVGGVSYRFMGESRSKFSAGTFFGPGYIRLKSSYHYLTPAPLANQAWDHRTSLLVTLLPLRRRPSLLTRPFRLWIIFGLRRPSLERIFKS